MNKVAAYLQEHLDGEVLTSAAIRDFFSTDASVLKLTPSMVIYPRTINDIRKVMRFSWQLAERGHVLPVTARGHGTDQSGGAIGDGIVMVFPAHMNKLLELDAKQGLARIQPGINYQTFEESMHTHGKFLPPYPASLAYSTVGGAIANNSAGEKSIKYGAMRQYVDRLEVVLANGEVMQTGRISKRELSRKKGQTNFEGEVYRQIDGIITDNWELIAANVNPRISKNSSGYDLTDVKRKDGSIDLTPLFVGSQGTLGVITEAIVRLEEYNPRTHLIVAEFGDLATAHDAISALLQLNPSALEMVDGHLIEFVERQHPKQLQGLLQSDAPAVVLLAEFDDLSERGRRHKSKKALKQLQGLAREVEFTDDYDRQQRLWSLRHSAATVINYNQDGKSALPIIEDGIVPFDQFEAYISSVYRLFEKYRLETAVWGHAGDANLHMQPLMNLSKITDRQNVFKIMEEYYDLVLAMGGSIAAEHNDGRLRAPFVEKQYGPDMAAVFKQVKEAFDPHNTLNSGVKVGTTLKDLMPMLRKEYSIAHLGDHLPRT